MDEERKHEKALLISEVFIGHFPVYAAPQQGW
jgi:hypothetical protein